MGFVSGGPLSQASNHLANSQPNTRGDSVLATIISPQDPTKDVSLKIKNQAPVREPKNRYMENLKADTSQPSPRSAFRGFLP